MSATYTMTNNYGNTSRQNLGFMPKAHNTVFLLSCNWWVWAILIQRMGKVTIEKGKRMHLVNHGGYCWKKVDSLSVAKWILSPVD